MKFIVESLLVVSLAAILLGATYTLSILLASPMFWLACPLVGTIYTVSTKSRGLVEDWGMSFLLILALVALRLAGPHLAPQLEPTGATDVLLGSALFLFSKLLPVL